MIIFGTRGSVSKPKAATNYRCSNCQGTEGYSSTVFRYFHIYWIPVIPTSKESVLSCANCKQTQVGKEIDQNANRFDASLGMQADKRPIYHWAGLALIALLASGVGYSEYTEGEQAKAYLENPQVGDLIVTKLETPVKLEGKGKARYGLYRVEEVLPEALVVRESNLIFSHSSDASTLPGANDTAKADPELFAEETKSWSRKNPDNLLTEHRIDSVVRKQG